MCPRISVRVNRVTIVVTRSPDLMDREDVGHFKVVSEVIISVRFFAFSVCGDYDIFSILLIR